MRDANESPDQEPRHPHKCRRSGLNLYCSVPVFQLSSSSLRRINGSLQYSHHYEHEGLLSELTELLSPAPSYHATKIGRVRASSYNLEMMSRLNIPSDSLLTVPSLRKMQGTACRLREEPSAPAGQNIIDTDVSRAYENEK
jgi:hypothetical protein